MVMVSILPTGRQSLFTAPMHTCRHYKNCSELVSALELLPHIVNELRLWLPIHLQNYLTLRFFKLSKSTKIQEEGKREKLLVSRSTLIK